MKQKIFKVSVHIICCVCFLALPILFAPDTPIYWFQADSYARHKLLLYVLLIGFFYFNSYVLIPRFYFRKMYLVYFLVCLVCFFAVTLAPDYLVPSANYYLPRHVSPPPGAAPPFFADVEQSHFQKPFYLPHISENFFLFLIVLFVSLTLEINSQLKRSEREKTKAQLSNLQAQINPHFLFNTLNSIYSEAISEKSPKTANSLVKLSGLMRYVTGAAHNDLVPLDKAINYITDYVGLQKMRLGDTVGVEYEVTGNLAGKKITPLLLIPFIENAFKHGVNSEEHSHIRITVDIKGNDLYLKVRNNKVTVQYLEARSNVGIQNTKNRLEMLYPGKHDLTIEDSKDIYEVNLHLNLS